MTTPKKRRANRRNARRSTGPKTPEGKARSARNALRHGFYARSIVIPGEDADGFRRLRAGLRDQLSPRGPLEEILLERIAAAAWRLRRAEAFQAALLTEEVTELAADFAARPGQAPPPPQRLLGRAVRQAFAHGEIEAVARHEQRIERAFYRALDELRRCQAARRRAEAAAQGRSRRTRTAPPRLGRPGQADAADVDDGAPLVAAPAGRSHHNPSVGADPTGEASSPLADGRMGPRQAAQRSPAEAAAPVAAVPAGRPHHGPSVGADTGGEPVPAGGAGVTACGRPVGARSDGPAVACGDTTPTGRARRGAADVEGCGAGPGGAGRRQTADRVRRAGGGGGSPDETKPRWDNSENRPPRAR